MRTRYPDQEGFVERDEVKIFYEVFGKGDPSVLLLPTWSILHSRLWKAQVPYLARHCRVITFDGRGNGRSSRPASTEPHSTKQIEDNVGWGLETTPQVLIATKDAPFSVDGGHFRTQKPA